MKNLVLEKQLSCKDIIEGVVRKRAGPERRGERADGHWPTIIATPLLLAAGE
jgi:hypothetical protein